MKYWKSIIILILTIFLFSIASVCASDANDTAIASEDTGQMELSSDNQITEDNLKTNEDNAPLAQANDDETVSAQTDSQTLSEGEGTYYDLREEIGNGGNKSLTKSYYSYTGGDAIEITTPGVIDGNGATIDMLGSNIRAFTVNACDVTIKNLTIKNANYEGNGGAVYFNSSGSVISCNFISNKAKNSGGAIGSIGNANVENCYFADNRADDWGGAIYFDGTGEVTNCKFKNNTAGVGGAVYIRMGGEVTNCNFSNNTAGDSGGAIMFIRTGKVTNCNFSNNTAGDSGGAIMFTSTGKVTNCNFVNNKATSNMYGGGAVYIRMDGEVTNCSFTNDTAYRGGAVLFLSNGEVTNCSFTNDTAYRGGAVFINHYGEVTNSNFADNTASSYAGAIWMEYGTVTKSKFINNVCGSSGAILSQKWCGVIADTCIFKTDSDTTYNVDVHPPTLNADNFTSFYNSGEKLTFDLKTNSNMTVNNGNISISVYYKNNNSWVGNYSCLSGEGWTVDLPIGYYYAVFNTEYAGFKPVNRTITVKIKTQLAASAVTTTYNVKRNLVITLKDGYGNALSGVEVTVKIKKAKTYSTDKNGQIKINVAKIVPKTYTAKITFAGNTNYHASYTNAKVTVKKAKPKLTAKKKTFKVKKAKKYTISLKTNKKKALKKVKVTLTVKVKGKKKIKITKKTSKKGKATFNLKKLTKKGTFKATVTFKGNKYYKKVTKKVKITIK